MKKQKMNNIKKIRKQLKISVTELALRINMSQASLTKIENNQVELKIELAEKISEALNVPLNAILETSSTGLTQIELINPEVFNLTQYQTLSIPSVMLPNNNQNLKAFVIEDDTMSPLLKKDTLAIINTDEKSLQNGIFLIDINNNLIVRRLQKTLQNTLLVIPENNSYQKEEIEETKLKIIGKISSYLSYNKF